MRWFTLKTAAEYVALSEKQLRNRCTRRLIQHRRDGNRGRGGTGEYRFLQEWLDDYIASVTVSAKTPEQSPSPKKPKLALSRKVYIPRSEWGSSV